MSHAIAAATVQPRHCPVRGITPRATHVRILDPLFSHMLFPRYVSALLWAGLWLRDSRVRGLLQARAA
jgi:hypothetical protein